MKCVIKARTHTLFHTNQANKNEHPKFKQVLKVVLKWYNACESSIFSFCCWNWTCIEEIHKAKNKKDEEMPLDWYIVRYFYDHYRMIGQKLVCFFFGNMNDGSFCYFQFEIYQANLWRRSNLFKGSLHISNRIISECATSDTHSAALVSVTLFPFFLRSFSFFSLYFCYFLELYDYKRVTIVLLMTK